MTLAEELKVIFDAATMTNLGTNLKSYVVANKSPRTQYNEGMNFKDLPSNETLAYDGTPIYRQDRCLVFGKVRKATDRALLRLDILAILKDSDKSFNVSNKQETSTGGFRGNYTISYDVEVIQ